MILNKASARRLGEVSRESTLGDEAMYIWIEMNYTTIVVCVLKKPEHMSARRTKSSGNSIVSPYPGTDQ